MLRGYTFFNLDLQNEITGESLKQNASDIVSNISEEVKSKGSNITKEVAKDVAANIGKQLQDLAK